MQQLRKMVNFQRLVLAGVLIGLSLFGCAGSSERMHPQFASFRQPMGVMLVLEPEIGIFEQMPDGSRLFQNDLSRGAQRQARQSIVQQLLKRHFAVRTADPGSMQAPEIKSITRLFRSVNRSIQLHTFGPQVFPAKLKSFDYYLGPVAGLLKANGADGLVLALGHQTSTDRPEKNWLSIAVVEPDGRIIWYGVQGDHNKYDLQNPEDVTALVASAMANFWEPGS